jgi:hypothetical protein
MIRLVEAPRAKYGGMDVSEAKRLKTLEEENTRHARQCGAEGFAGKEVVTPAAERRAII